MDNTVHYSDQFILHKQQKTRKKLLIQAIKTGDLSLVKKLRRLYNFLPNEELSDDHHFWTSLHYACSFDQCIVLDFLLKLTYDLHKDDYSKIINLKTSEGWNLLMITSIYGANNCLNLLLKYGGIRLYEKDNNDLRAHDLAKKHGHAAVYKTLIKQAEAYPLKVITEPEVFEIPCNIRDLTKGDETVKLADVEDLNKENIEDKPEYKNLLKNGTRLPCKVCLGQKGWIKYTECCGNPIHPLCRKGMKNCPECNRENFILISEIKYPERAFVLEMKE